MIFEHLQDYWLPYTISNTIAVVIVVLAWKQSVAARIALGVIFLLASIVNTSMAIATPSDYHDYLELAQLQIYRTFISGWFAQHTQAMVLAIAAGQLLIAIGMFARQTFLRRLAIVGVVIFGVAIAPLGVGSAFPCSIVLAIAAILLWNRDPGCKQSP